MYNINIFKPNKEDTNLSKVQEIKEMLFDYFCDENLHTIDEFRQEAIKRGIIADPNDSAISNAIFALKDNTRFETVDKGRYIIYKSDKGEKGMSV